MEKAATKIGWIGTGVMGKSMCRHLMKAGHKLLIYSRTAKKTEELVKDGAQFADPAEIAKNSDIIFVMVGYPRDVEEVVLGPKGVLASMHKGAYLVDHTTSSPTLAQRIYEAATKVGVNALDAPVSGGDVGAKNGKLVVMVGGDAAAVEKMKPLMQCYSASIAHMGAAGFGQHTKMANQVIIAGQMIGVVEGLMYAYKAGVPLPQMIELLSKGAASSFGLTSYAPRMLKRDMEPGFFVEHFVKDMEIALDECRRMSLALPGLALVHQLYVALKANGGAKNGTQALIKVLEQLNNVQIPKML